MLIKKHILIVAPYITFQMNLGLIVLLCLLHVNQKYSVTLVTSKFCHILKSIRVQNPNMQDF